MALWLSNDPFLHANRCGKCVLPMMIVSRYASAGMRQGVIEMDESVISRHIRNIFEEGGLDSSQTVANNAMVQFEGNKTVKRTAEFYHLDVIIPSKAKLTQADINAFNALEAFHPEAFLSYFFILQNCFHTFSYSFILNYFFHTLSYCAQERKKTRRLTCGLSALGCGFELLLLEFALADEDVC